MSGYRRLAVFLLGLPWCIGSAWAQMSAQEELRTLRGAPGIKVQLFAAEPLVVNPAAIDVDTHGRVWVAEIRYYRRGPKKPADSIKVLEDTDGDGRADRAHVFATGLLAPMSICVAGSKVYVATSPDLWVFEDRDGDLRADGPPRKLLTGFGGYNHDHGAHSLVLGPDHKWWMAHGDLGFHLRGTDGSVIQYRWGAIIRGELDGSQLELVAVNFRNPYEVAIDSFGRAWCSDNDNDGNFSTRICWILPGGNYGWYGRPPFQLAELNRRLPPGVPFRQAWHFRGHVPGHVPGTLVTGFGSPCGMCVYEGEAFAPQWRGAPWHVDAGPRELRVYPHRVRGYGMVAQARNLLTTAGDNYFRPVDVCVAPDGSVLVADWYDSVVGGHAYTDPHRGRIFRLVPAQGKLQRREKPGPYGTIEDAILGLQSPNLATQFLARQKLLSEGSASVPALTHLARTGRDVYRARALWVLDRIGGSARQVVLDHLHDPDPRFRALAVRILARHGSQYEQALLALAADPSAQVRRELLLAMPGFRSAKAQRVLLELARTYQGQDRYLLECVVIAAAGRRKALFEQLARDRHGLLRRYELLWALAPREAPRVLEQLDPQEFAPEDIGRVVRFCTFDDSLQLARVVLELLQRKDVPAEQKLALVQQLAVKLQGPWASLRDKEELGRTLRHLLAQPQLAPAVLEAVRTLKLRSWTKPIRQMAQTAALPQSLRRQAVELLVELNRYEFSPTLVQWALGDDPLLRQAALEGLSGLQDTRALRQLLLGSQASQQVKRQVLRALMSSTGGALALLRLVQQDQLPQAWRQQVLQLAARHPDANVRELYKEFLPPALRTRRLGRQINPEAILALKGDPRRGERIFFESSAAQCQKCHRVRGRGGTLGPNLSQIGRKYDRRALLEAILNPSQAIAPEYTVYLVQTHSGHLHVGFLVRQDAKELVLRDANDRLVRIARSEVAAMQRQSKSLMPELVLQDLSAQDAADLLAFLQTLREAQLTVDRALALGPWPLRRDDELDRPFPVERDLNHLRLKATYQGLDRRRIGWQTIWATAVSGQVVLDLAAWNRLNGFRETHVLNYLAFWLHSAQPQQATLLVASQGAWKLWVNGAEVFRSEGNTGGPEAPAQVHLPLQAGNNLVVLKVLAQQGPNRVSLTVRSPRLVQLRTEP